MAVRALEPIKLPAEFWDRVEVSEALRARDVGRLFKLIKKYGGASQTRIGVAAGMTQGQASPLMNGLRKVEAISVLERIADGFDMPNAA